MINNKTYIIRNQKEIWKNGLSVFCFLNTASPIESHYWQYTISFAIILIKKLQLYIDF